MFGLLSTLAEIISSHATRLLDRRDAVGDVDVAEHVLHIVLEFQNIADRGQQLLAFAAQFADPPAVPPETLDAAAFQRLLEAQVAALGGATAVLERSRPLLSTLDASLTAELAPLLDGKSGLVTRWNQQVSQSSYSTTTLFFLPADDIRHLVRDGTASGPGELGFVDAVASSIRRVREGEVRDLRMVAATEQRERIRAGIVEAHADLERTRECCSRLLQAMKDAVGGAAMAGLRRKLLRSARDQ